MGGMTLQIPVEFQKSELEGVTESVVTTQEETEEVTVEVDEAEAVASQSSSAKSEKFKALAQKRVDKILEEIDRLTPLSNRRNYDYDEELVSQMFDIIRHELDKQQKLFYGIRTPRFQFRK